MIKIIGANGSGSKIANQEEAQLKNKRLAIISINGEFYDNQCYPTDVFTYSAYLHSPDHDSNGKDGTLDLIDISGTNLRAVIRESQDALHELGYTHVLIDTDPYPLEHRLYNSRRRIAQIERSKAIRKRERRDRRNKLRRMRRAQSLLAEMDNPTQQTIRNFYRAWKKVTGYGPNKDEELRAALSPVKDALMRHLLLVARQRGWPAGQAYDAGVGNRYKSILYVDTPEGQASFHFRPGALGDLPKYEGQWSGRHDSAQILARLFGSMPQPLRSVA